MINYVDEVTGGRNNSTVTRLILEEEKRSKRTAARVRRRFSFTLSHMGHINRRSQFNTFQSTTRVEAVRKCCDSCVCVCVHSQTSTVFATLHLHSVLSSSFRLLGLICRSYRAEDNFYSQRIAVQNYFQACKNYC